MFDAEYGGWLDDIRYITTTAGDMVVPLPQDLAQIKVVRYKVDSSYIPLSYDKQERSAQADPAEGDTGGPSSYRLVGDRMYFNPALSEGGTNYLQIEGTYYPEPFTNKLDKISGIWNPAFRNYIKYRSASILVAAKMDGQPPWAPYEYEWKAELRKLIAKRVNTSTTVKEF